VVVRNQDGRLGFDVHPHIFSSLGLSVFSVSADPLGIERKFVIIRFM